MFKLLPCYYKILSPLLYNKLHLALACNISVLSILYVNLPWAAPVEPSKFVDLL